MRARAIELIAWIAGIALLGGYAAARVSFENARVAGIEAFHESRATADPSATPSLPSIDQSLWSEQRVAAYRASADPSGPPLGLLRIPALALEVPIWPGTSEANLSRGAAHIEGTSDLDGNGNIGLASHRDGFFRALKDIAIDDELKLEVAGRDLVFKVVDLAVVSPRATGVLAPTERPSVTLVTCYPFYFVGHAPQRYIVRAELHAAVAAWTSGESTVNPNASERNEP